MVTKAIEMVMSSHFYRVGDRIYRQRKGGAIGMRLTGVVARCYMLWWDKKLSAKLVEAGVRERMRSRYVDDGNMYAERVEKGWRWEERTGRMRYCEEWAEEEEEMEDDEKTMIEVKRIGESISRAIKLTIDTPSRNINTKG